MTQYVYSMVNLRKIYPPNKEVLKGIYLSFLPGAKIGVLGLNGSGKSTLLKIMAGVEKNFQGAFNPIDIANNIVKKIIPTLHDLTQQEFKIVRRFGSWVYLNRGRAYGLTIGTRLVGENNSKLHIIRYAPYLEGEIDSAVAFIRHENKDIPLQVGDVLKIDQTVYPR